MVSYMQQNDEAYKHIVKHLSEHGKQSVDRTGVGTKSLFAGYQYFDISGYKIPIIGIKKTNFKDIVVELLWMLSGSDRLKYLKDHKVNIWDEWVIKGTEVYDENGKLIDGSLNEVYGAQWRHWEDTRIIKDATKEMIEQYKARGFMVDHYKDNLVVITRRIDQLKNVIDGLKNNPHSRRHMLSAWNVGKIDEMALPPCHYNVQFYVNQHNQLESLVNMRSNDVGLGRPYNIVQYALLSHIIAEEIGTHATAMTLVTADTHLYSNHEEPIKVIFDRESYDCSPTVQFQKKEIIHYTPDDFVLEDYTHHPIVKLPIAV